MFTLPLHLLLAGKEEVQKRENPKGETTTTRGSDRRPARSKERERVRGSRLQMKVFYLVRVAAGRVYVAGSSSPPPLQCARMVPGTSSLFSALPLLCSQVRNVGSVFVLGRQQRGNSWTFAGLCQTDPKWSSFASPLASSWSVLCFRIKLA